MLNGHKEKKKFMREIKYQKRLHKEPVKCPSLEIVKTHLDMSLSILIQL